MTIIAATHFHSTYVIDKYHYLSTKNLSQKQSEGTTTTSIYKRFEVTQNQDFCEVHKCFSQLFFRIL